MNYAEATGDSTTTVYQFAYGPVAPDFREAGELKGADHTAALKGFWA